MTGFLMFISTLSMESDIFACDFTAMLQIQELLDVILLEI